VQGLVLCLRYQMCNWCVLAFHQPTTGGHVYTCSVSTLTMWQSRGSAEAGTDHE
jgi:hypothetical protein